jgi:hypothetical protein
MSWFLRWNGSSFLCWYNHMSMSWADLDSFKSFAPVIVVDELNSIPIHVYSSWSTSKHGLIRLWVLHFRNFFGLRLKKI